MRQSIRSWGFLLGMFACTVWLGGCGTAHSLRDTPYDSGVKVAYTAEQGKHLEAKLQELLDSNEYSLMSRETFSGKTVIFLENGAQVNTTSGQRGVNTGRLLRVVRSAEGADGNRYVVAREKFGLSGADTQAAARSLANRLVVD